MVRRMMNLKDSEGHDRDLAFAWMGRGKTQIQSG
jgi:hypothetical protein